MNVCNNIVSQNLSFDTLEFVRTLTVFTDDPISDSGFIVHWTVDDLQTANQ